MGYDFVSSTEGGVSSYSLPFLGAAQIAATDGRGLFVPMSDAVLEVWLPGARRAERRVALPLALSPYSREAIQSARDRAVSRVSGDYARQLQDRFDGALRDLPPLAPPAQRIVGMGGDAWVQPFAADSGDRDWIVVSPASGAVLATVAVDPNMTLLAGSASMAVLLGRTEVLEEQFVQLRRIDRNAGR